MSLIRIILAIILLYYLLKLLRRWMFSGSKRTSVDGIEYGGNKEKYRNLTDQAIEDADYEEIEKGDDV
ncbi:MAG: hypothetical protein KAX38_04230 [Candidatus Krumholzibacteria bacterium]|nr:hypothetical protein [Candidatus Krumholzibacteria bacterium]